MLLLMSGEGLLAIWQSIYNLVFSFMAQPVFTYHGKPIALWTVLLFGFGVTLFIDMCVVIAGGSPDD